MEKQVLLQWLQNTTAQEVVFEDMDGGQLEVDEAFKDGDVYKIVVAMRFSR